MIVNVILDPLAGVSGCNFQTTNGKSCGVPRNVVPHLGVLRHQVGSFHSRLQSDGGLQSVGKTGCVVAAYAPHDGTVCLLKLCTPEMHFHAAILIADFAPETPSDSS